ncbi:amidase signature domain-containing protein [Aspergillus multicolor]|uniref:amidase signature domain-containing protein n=1 Tax=Aspergillus multicolor TaxID=41759 RepID=UPI003CCD442E
MHISRGLSQAAALYATAVGVASALPSGAAIVPVDPFPMPPCNGIVIEDAPIRTIQQYMVDGKLTSQDLVNCYLDRIDQTNQYLHSISEINPDALAIAASMDEERTAGNGTIRSPIHGIPFLVKDNFYTDDTHNTSEGTLVLLAGRYSSEATVVTKMREAGAVLLGHSTMSEAADHRALSDYASGYSSRTGQTRNPYNLTQPTAGSSSGSVVAVRSNQVAIALGTETHGSLTHPSGQLGLYTIKSTPGLLSRHGIVTGSYYHDTPGPLARSMSDVAVLMDILKGPDARDNLTFQAAGRYPPTGYTGHLVGQDALKGMKLGIPWSPYWETNGHINSPGNRYVYETSIEALTAAGAEIYNITSNPFAEIANPYGSSHPANIAPEHNHVIAFSTLMAVGYAEWLRNWTFPAGDARQSMSTLADMAAWNDAHNTTTGALGNDTWWWDKETGQSFYDTGVETNGSMGSAFWTAFGWGRFTARDAIDSAHSYVLPNGTVIELDGLLVPNGRDGGQGNACASVPSYAGYPVATVPIGQDNYSTPYGLCIYGRQYGEPKLVEVASAMEDLFRWNARPGWFNYGTAEGPWDDPWPGYTCSEESLEGYGCEDEDGNET